MRPPALLRSALLASVFAPLPLLAPTAAQATPTLLAVGTLNGASDLSPVTGTLEDGTPQNQLGGMGSAMAWAGGNTFLLAPDRGPNASTYNAAVDNTTSYINRYR